MARKKRPGDVFLQCNSDETYNKLLDGLSETTVVPPPDEMLAWLQRERDRVQRYVEDILADSPFSIEQRRREMTVEEFHEPATANPLAGVTICAADTLVDVIDDVRDALQGAVAGPSWDAFTHGVRIGLLHGLMQSLANGTIQSSWLRREASVKGGKATTKWTPDVAEKARAIFAEEEKGKQVSADATYRRTVAKLKNEHEIEISKDTLKRHLPPPAQR